MSIRVSLVTLGDPNRLTGGYLFHRRIADLASRHDASLTFASIPDGIIRATRSAAKVFRRAELFGDVIVCDSLVAPWVGLGGKRRTVIPMVGMLHQPPGGIDGRPLRRVLQSPFDVAGYRRMDHLMVASEPLRAHFLGRGFAEEALTLVAPGRDRPLLDDRPEDVGDLRNGRRAAFLCVGNWMARKGIVDLLDAFAMLPDEVGCLHLVGDPSVEPAYERRVRRRLTKPSLARRVIVHGPVSRARVDALYRAADVFVLPSVREPYGTVYGEAMAVGLPVIGWRAGNLPHLIEQGREGLYNEVGDLRGLAASMTKVAMDDSVRGTMSAAALQRGAALPTWEETAKLFFATLRRVLDVDPTSI